MTKKVDFKHLVAFMVIMWCVRSFVVGPFEPCFFITGILSAIMVFRWKGGRRATGIVLLLVSLAGLVWDISARLDERRIIKEKHERIKNAKPPK
jgi:hypothetical protein